MEWDTSGWGWHLEHLWSGRLLDFRTFFSCSTPLLTASLLAFSLTANTFSMSKLFSSDPTAHMKWGCTLVLPSLCRSLFRFLGLQVSENTLSTLRCGRRWGKMKRKQNISESILAAQILTRRWLTHFRQLAAVGSSVPEAWQQELWRRNHLVFGITPKWGKKCFPC